MLGPHCYQHAWHAELWRLRLPELKEPDEHRAAPPNPEFAAFMEGAHDEGDQTIEKLVGVYRMLVPHLLAVYIFHQKCWSSTSSVGHPLLRTRTDMHGAAQLNVGRRW